MELPLFARQQRVIAIRGKDPNTIPSIVKQFDKSGRRVGLPAVAEKQITGIKDQAGARVYSCSP